MWFYTCNNKTFDFKLLAIDEHLKTKQSLHFHAPVEYNTFNFSVEPNETWATLLKNEAIKLRETYQFIKLWYSGGADSHLILTTFIENNIHIDEICCMKSGFEDADYEINNYAEPFLKTIQKQIPKTKINIINPTILDYENYYNKKFTKNSSGFSYYCFRLIYHDELIKDYNQKRIENFIPDSLLDLEINKSVLLEYNFDSINAIDWNKGCYVGQEITARMKYRALLKKSLTKISIIDGNVKPHDDIFFDKRSIGSVSSVSKDIGLAILRIDDAKNAFTNDKILETKEGRVKINF